MTEIAPNQTTIPIVAAEDIQVVFDSGAEPIIAVDGVSLSVAPGEIVGLVGESGSGKSMTAYALLGLIEFMGGKMTAGRIRFKGHTDAPDWRAVRGRIVSMIFQEPLTSLNPLQTVGTQLREAMHDVPAHSWRRRAADLLSAVQVHDAELRLDQYPHEFSGGMRQRMMIAMALAQDPMLLVADEPTTALDVTVQKETIELIRRLREDKGLAILFISHDLALVGEFCDRLLVMYGGHVVEDGPTAAVIAAPRHPYTKLLLRSRPQANDPDELHRRPRDRRRLAEMPGTMKPVSAPARLCRFLDRCPLRVAACETMRPPMKQDENYRVLCHVA